MVGNYPSEFLVSLGIGKVILQCNNCMLLFYSNVFEPCAAGTQSDVIFLDFSKAFDSVPHQELLFAAWSISYGSGSRSI